MTFVYQSFKFSFLSSAVILWISVCNDTSNNFICHVPWFWKDYGLNSEDNMLIIGQLQLGLLVLGSCGLSLPKITVSYILDH